MDSSILDTMLNAVATACAGNGTIYGYAKSLFGYLIAIDFVTVVLMNLLSFGGGQSFISMTVSKVMAYGFWLWIIQNWGYFCNVVVHSLTTAATSFGSLPADVLKRPSQLIDIGFESAFPFFDYLTQDTSWTNIVAKFGIYFMTFICAWGLIIAFALIAFQVFVTYIEFYVCSALMLLFLPFATNKYTERFAQNCIGGVFSHGVKLMFLGAIISLSGPMIDSLNTNFTGTPTWDHLFSCLLAPWAICFLCWQAPSMAAGFMSGGPVLSAATMGSNAIGGANTAMSGLRTGMAIGAATVGAVAGAAKAASTVAGAVGAGLQGGAGDGSVGSAAGGVGTYAGSRAKEAFNNYVKEPMKQSYQSGFNRVAGAGLSDSETGSSMGEGDFSKS